MLAASSVVNSGREAPARTASDRAVAPAQERSASIATISERAQRSQQLTKQARRKVSALGAALTMSRKLASAESAATRVTAKAMIDCGRKASQANDFVQRHPWRAVLLAGGAGLVVALLSGREQSPPSEDVTDATR
jgi:membrane protein